MFGSSPWKHKNSKTVTREFSNIITKSERKPFKLESYWGAGSFNSIYKNFLKCKNFHKYSRFIHKGLSIAERLIRTVRSLLKKRVFEKGKADCLSELLYVVKQYNITIHNSTSTTPIEASKKQTKNKSIPILRIGELDKNQI